MKIQEIISVLESVAPPSLQESYDNAGLLTGNSNSECTGIITTLDATEGVVQEAIDKGCNLVVAHHPIIFGGLRKITGKNYVEQTIITAIKNDIAIYAIHTNLDNVLDGVNGAIADKLGLVNRSILKPKNDTLKKMIKDKEISEDDERRAQDEIQKMTDIAVAEVDKLLQAKEVDLRSEEHTSELQSPC